MTVMTVVQKISRRTGADFKAAGITGDSLKVKNCGILFVSHASIHLLSIFKNLQKQDKKGPGTFVLSSDLTCASPWHMRSPDENITIQQRLLVILWLHSALQARALVVSVLLQQWRSSYGSSERMQCVCSSLFGNLPAGRYGLSELPGVLSPRWSKEDKLMHVTQVPNVQEYESRGGFSSFHPQVQTLLAGLSLVWLRHSQGWHQPGCRKWEKSLKI